MTIIDKRIADLEFEEIMRNFNENIHDFKFMHRLMT